MEVTRPISGVEWSSQDYHNVDGLALNISGIYERPGMRDAVIARVRGEVSENPFKVGDTVFVRTKNYDCRAKIFFIQRGSEGYNIYLKMPFEGTDPNGGQLSMARKRIFRNIVENEKQMSKPLLLAIVLGSILVGTVIFFPKVLKR